MDYGSTFNHPNPLAKANVHDSLLKYACMAVCISSVLCMDISRSGRSHSYYA